MNLRIDTRRTALPGYFKFIPIEEPDFFELRARRKSAPIPIVERLTSPLVSARIFVGLVERGVAGKSDIEHDLDELIGTIKRVRRAQGVDPDSTTLFGRGRYTSERDKKLNDEPSVQAIVLSVEGEDDEVFEKHMEALADESAVALGQEVIYVEMQRDGVRTVTLKVRHP